MIRRIGRALILACPNCGQRGIFDTWTRLADSCPRCGLRFERHEGYWLGAIAINTGLVMVALIGTLVGVTVLTWPNPPWTALTVGLVVVAVAVPVLAYPLSKTIWLALDLGMNPADDPG